MGILAEAVLLEFGGAQDSDRAVKFLTANGSFSYTLDNALAAPLFKMKSNKPSKGKVLAVGALAGGAGGIAAGMASYSKYQKSDKLKEDITWFKDTVSTKGTDSRTKIDQFVQLKAETLKKARAGEQVDLAPLKKLWIELNKSAVQAFKQYNKGQKKQGKLAKKVKS